MQKYLVGLSIVAGLTILSTSLMVQAGSSSSSSSSLSEKQPSKAVLDYGYTGSMMHNVLKRSLAEIIRTLQEESDAVIIEPTAENSNVTLKADFKGYLKAYLLFMQSHRMVETEHGFPMARNLGLKFPDSFDDDHEKIGLRLDSLAESVELGFQSKESFIGQWQDVQEMVTKHFNDEEMTTTTEALVAANVTDAIVLKAGKGAEAETKKFDPTAILPFLYFNMTEEERARFWDATFPWILRKAIFPILKRVKGSYWKYACFY